MLMNGGTSRFEARSHPVSAVPGVLGAWDHQHDDWARDPGPVRSPLVFVSKGQLLQWAERQESRPAASEHLS